MADLHQIIFYPVNNGDTTQIILDNGRRILFDFRHYPTADQNDTPEIDLKAHLKAELKKINRDYFDVVAFTHADLDHIEGSTDFFELLHADKYQGDDRIKINELWVPAAMLLETAANHQQSDEFVILRQEARHRLLEGKGIRVFSKPQVLMDWLEPRLKERKESVAARDHLFVDAGKLVPGFTLDDDKVEFFCHSPFIKHCDDGDIIRNEASLVFNVRFRVNGERYDYLEVGDATWDMLEDIIDITKKHNNTDRLEWNLYNIPHHCSYKALSDEKGEKETEPTDLIKDLLLLGKKDAYIVSCSKAIENDSDAYEQIQPPHVQAKNAYVSYLKKVDGRKFLVTMEEPNTKKPEPITFNVAWGGITLKQLANIGTSAIIGSAAPRAGYAE